MALPFYNWSRTAASNATADATVNWAEGQAPSSVNDSARAMMASTAAYRDDVAGAIATGGTSTAYTVTSYEIFDSYAHMSGQLIAFTPHATNGDSPTLNVDGLGARFLRGQSGQNLTSGVLVAGTPYVALYNNSNTEFVLQNFFSNPYNIPIGAGLEYWGTTAPNSAFVFPLGQAISRTTYSTLFTLFSTTYGTGDGSTTFNLPDKRGRVSACPDTMGGGDASRLSTGALSGVRMVLGGAGGESAHPLVAGEIPSITSVNASQSITVAGPTGHTMPLDGSIVSDAGTGGAGNHIKDATQGTGSFTGSNSISVTSSGTNGTAHNNIQPTILCNYIIRVI